ncbi:MAG: IPT/TIG domain-containing protein, partial [Bacteroidota bacterium]
MDKNKNTIWLAIAAIFLITYVTSCSGDDDATTILPPTISAVIPGAGVIGTSVTVQGTNFSIAPSDNIVDVNGKVAEVTAASTTQLVLTVPEGATTGKIRVNVDGKSVSSSSDFEVLPLISAFEPLSGTVGTEVVISGSGFGAGGDNEVMFNGTSATVKGATATTLTVEVPLNVVSGKITVSVSGNETKSSDDFVIKPELISFTPTSGMVGTEVVLSGTGFSPNTAENSVTINDKAAVIKAVSGTEIKIDVPAGVTTGKIVIEVNGQKVVSEKDFVVKETPETVPSITSFTPALGPVGTEVTIRGTNFSETSTMVEFNGTLSTPTSVTASELLVMVPSGATTGKIKVSVDGAFGVSADDFVVEETPETAPSITSFTPASGPVGTEITITGTNFSETSTVVEFNGTLSTPTSVTASELLVMVPSGATTGKIKVSVGSEFGVSADDFVVEETPETAPLVTSFTPASGPVGTEVTIRGTNFSETSTMVE